MERTWEPSAVEAFAPRPLPSPPDLDLGMAASPYEKLQLLAGIPLLRFSLGPDNQLFVLLLQPRVDLRF